MEAFIRSASAISPQNTFSEDSYLEESVAQGGTYLKCLEPDYKEYIDPKLTRRMARIIKMGVASATKALQDAGVTNPDAIIMGTGLGCLKDTERFLTDIIENKEGVLSPTPFIQSTHNTIGGQIALMLGCKNFNFTYVHRGHSFESSLLDGMFKLEEGAANVLVGGVDEATQVTFEIMRSMGCIAGNHPEIGESAAKNENPILGEGASFFVISKNADAQSFAKISGLKTFYNPENVNDAKEEIVSFLDKNGVEPEEISVFLGGMNGVSAEDRYYREIHEALFSDKPLVGFKNLCGEYQTASAFGLNLAAHMMKRQRIYSNTLISGPEVKSLRHVLLYNHYKTKNHNLILLSKCQPTG